MRITNRFEADSDDYQQQEYNDSLVDRPTRSSHVGSVIDGEYEEEDTEPFQCPSCLEVHIASTLTRKIIYVAEKSNTPIGPRFRIIRKKDKALSEYGFDPEKDKEYLMCRRCGDLYDLNDLMQERKYQKDLAEAIERKNKYWNPNPPPRHVRKKKNVAELGSAEPDTVEDEDETIATPLDLEDPPIVKEPVEEKKLVVRRVSSRRKVIIRRRKQG